MLASLLEHLIIPDILKVDALHEAEFALASQVDEGSRHMPLAWVAAEQLLRAELPSRGGPFISVAVAGVQAGLVTAAEVAESLWVSGDLAPSSADLGAESSSISPLAPRSTSIDALFTASFLMPNFRVGFTMTAWLPAFPTLSTLELFAGRVVSVPFDGSTVVEGTVCPTTASSLDAEVRGILAAGFKKAKI